MEELLKQIAKNAESKEPFQIILSGNTTRFTANFDSPLTRTSSNYEVALVNLETWYSFTNIDPTNNVLRYSNDKGDNSITATNF